MADVKNDEEEKLIACSMPAKRKPDLASVGETKDVHPDSEKKQKLEPSPDDNSCSVAQEEKKIHDEEDDEDDDEEDYEEEDGDEDEAEDEDEDEAEDSEEQSNGQAEVDRKGKGILREDKGKGKLIEESDDSSDGGSESDGDSSDLSEDPLAEVDLDNILPSRTRRGVVQPGLNISNNLGNNHEDDSDDSDA